MSNDNPTICPNCNYVIDEKSADLYVQIYKIGGNQAKVFRLLFRRFGTCVSTEVILDELYGDCPNGGPDNGDRAVHKTIDRLRKCIKQSGDNTLIVMTEFCMGYTLQKKSNLNNASNNNQQKRRADSNNLKGVSHDG